MCGIAGVVSEETSDRAPELVREMLKAIRHRGPDDEGLVANDHATIGARRLSIIDLQNGHQPMTNETGDIVAVQNGEIYNYKQLRDDLTSRGHRLQTDNDTEVLPHAYEEWGVDFVSRLRGMFAMALWDGTNRLLLLARDRFGEKPLVYAHNEGRLLFSSEIQGLLRHPSISVAIDDTAIAQYLSVGYVPAPRSAFAAIRKVPPGHRLIFRNRGCVVQRYWHLSFSPKMRISPDEAAEEFRRLLDEAVRMRLMADVPLGAFLSGGLDSSSVVAFMAEHSSTPVKTFSIGFKDQRLDELGYARTIAQAYETDHHEFVVDAAETSVLPMLVRHLGEPFSDPSIVPTYHVARITRAEVTVALTGDGGDELLAGYDRYRVAAMAHMTVDRLPKTIARTLGTMAELIPVTPRVPRSIRRLRRLMAALSLPPDKRHLSLTSYFTGPTWQKVVGPRLHGLADYFVENQLQEASSFASAEDAAERLMASDIANYLPDDLLVKMDIATMANSLESRAPFLDHELAEFVARLPRVQKLSVRTSKLLLRRAMRGRLPERILTRGKMGFSPPVADWLRGPLRSMLVEFAESSVAVEHGYVAPGAMRRLFEEHDALRADHSAFLWSLLILELWLRESVQGQGREALKRVSSVS